MVQVAGVILKSFVYKSEWSPGHYVRVCQQSKLFPSASLQSFDRPQIWKYIHGRKKRKKKKIMLSLVATTSTLAPKTQSGGNYKTK